MLIWRSHRDIEGSRGLQGVPEGADRTGGMAMISGMNQLGPRPLQDLQKKEQVQSTQ